MIPTLRRSSVEDGGEDEDTRYEARGEMHVTVFKMSESNERKTRLYSDCNQYCDGEKKKTRGRGRPS